MRQKISLTSSLRAATRGAWPAMVTFLSVLFLSASLATDSLAQDKKNKKDKKSEREQAIQDSIARVNYERELNKNWSFGWENYKNKQYADVSRYFWKVAELDTGRKFTKLYNYLGQSYFELGLPDSAQMVYEKGVEIFPEDAGLRRNLAYLFTARDQLDKAIEEYEKIQELGEVTEDDLRRLAPLYVRTNQNDKAIKAYEDLLAKVPNDQEALNTLSALYKATGEEGKMLENLEATLARNPNDSKTLFTLAKARFDRQEYDLAIKHLQDYRKLVPNDWFAVELMGNAQQNLGKYREAIVTYDEIVKANPDHKKVWVEMSHCHRELGDFSSARRAANRALQADAKYGEAFIAIGRAIETCADKCSNNKGKRDFNDKLVYKMAYNQYQQALQDLDSKAEARQRIEYLQPAIPTNEDYFMNKNQDKPQGECYTWLR